MTGADHDCTLREAALSRVLWERAFEIVLVLRDDGTIIDANPRAVEAYGRSLEELRALRVHDLRAQPTRSDVGEQMRRAFATGIAFETEHTRADGSVFPVEVSSARTELNGEVVLFSVIRDVTLSRRMRAELAEADRLAVVGMLAAGVAHEVNNPLTYASASVELALRDMRAGRDTERIVELLTTATDGLDRVRSIVSDLMTLAYREVRELVPLDVTSVLESCINLAAHELRSRARVIREYTRVPLVLADAGRLGQVFLNLIANAAQSMPEGRPASAGEVRVEVRSAPGGRVEVCIGDNGRGIAPELTERVFEPFVTTKRSGRGLGLGLYLSRSLVEAMNGTVAMQSVVGEGSTFVVSLPAAMQVTPEGEPKERSGRGRVLVVDDEPMIGRVLAAALRPELDVMVVEDAEAALTAIRTTDFDAVVCDVVLPARSGLDLLAELEQTHPELARRFILMTGGASAGDASEIQRRGTRCLSKPFSVDEVRSAIRHARGG